MITSPDCESRVLRRRNHSAIRTINTLAMRMHAPNAKTPGRSLGNRNWFHIKTGKVGSVLPKKNAMMNSSKEMVKVSSKLATIPGNTFGKVTRQNVHQPFSPKSYDF